MLAIVIAGNITLIDDTTEHRTLIYNVIQERETVSTKYRSQLIDLCECVIETNLTEAITPVTGIFVY